MREDGDSEKRRLGEGERQQELWSQVLRDEGFRLERLGFVAGVFQRLEIVWPCHNTVKQQIKIAG